MDGVSFWLIYGVSFNQFTKSTGNFSFVIFVRLNLKTNAKSEHVASARSTKSAHLPDLPYLPQLGENEIKRNPESHVLLIELLKKKI